jgi:hypothetical protein
MEVPQVAFTKGEISPIAAARTDQQMYASALQTSINALIHAEGGASNRPGLQFVGNCLTNTPNGSYLLPFIYNNQQTYVTEFSAGNIQFFSKGAFVQNIAGMATITNVVLVQLFLTTLVYTAANSFSVGQTVTVSGVNYTGNVNPNGTFQIASASPTSFVVGVPNLSPTFSYVSGGTATTPLNLTNPYSLADLPNLRWAQSADTLNIVVNTQPLQQLKRFSANSYALATGISLRWTNANRAIAAIQRRISGLPDPSDAQRAIIERACAVLETLTEIPPGTYPVILDGFCLEPFLGEGEIVVVHETLSPLNGDLACFTTQRPDVDGGEPKLHGKVVSRGEDGAPLALACDGVTRLDRVVGIKRVQKVIGRLQRGCPLERGLLFGQ